MSSQYLLVVPESETRTGEVWRIDKDGQIWSTTIDRSIRDPEITWILRPQVDRLANEAPQ
jgi:hypothetical protein